MNKISQILIGILIGGILIFLLSNLKISNLGNKSEISSKGVDDKLIQQIIAQVLPQEGFKTKIVFGDAVKKMIDCGVIDLEKMKKLYNGKIPEYIRGLITDYTQTNADNIKSQTNADNDYTKKPIIINQETANYLLNLFWPLGLSNKTEFNKNIPFSEKELPYLASTGGWWLGKKENGAEYFNKCEIIKLTPQQEEIVYRVAQNTFRPCCDNSTFAQDCNHGSALLGALELAASQGYSEDELYKLALELNSFWFSQNYIKIALYKKLVEGKDWPLAQNYAELTQNLQKISEKSTELSQNLKNTSVSSESFQYISAFKNNSASSVLSSESSALIREIMSAKFSSISGYIQNVEKKLANVPNIPSTGSGCGL
ncbi:MAG: hypothetical protein KatS3mg095_0471 [Candidatus Parcubacteria bacterium]|nr:MAG: hypothetical protein KatS3mg095_0471 [Candidatus Parcubacteria bacterium]